MRTLLTRIILFVSPLLAISLSSHLFYFSTYSNRDPNYLFKREIFEKNEDRTRRVFLIGGSNCRYSYSSEVITSYLPDYSVVNAAIAAPLGLRFHLDYIKPYLKKNDLVILSPEYELLSTKNGVYGEEGLVLMANSYPGFYQWIFSDYHSAKHFISLTPKHLIKLLDKVIINKDVSFTDRNEEIRAKHDSTGQVEYYPPVNSYSNYIVLVDKYPLESIPLLEDFSLWCKKKEVGFVITFPSVESSHYRQFINDTKYVSFLKESLPKAKIIGSPSKSVYSRNMFHDSPYHLNKEGKMIHTENLMLDLIPLKQDLISF